MRRYPIVSTVVIVILLVLLAGSWTWFLVFGEGDAASGPAPQVVPAPAGQEPIADRSAGTDASQDDTRAGGFVKPPDRERPGRDASDPADQPHGRAQAPDAVETGKHVESGSAEEGTDDDEIVVERKALDPGVVDSDGETEGLEAFVVSTLVAPESRRRSTQWHGDQFASGAFRNDELGVKSRGKLRGVQMPIPPPVITHVLRGKLIYPEIGEVQQKLLTDDQRFQVTMYTPELPLMREVVGTSGEFVVPMTDAMVRNYERRGQRVFVHSPAFRLKSGKDYVDFRKDRTEFEIELELTPPLQVIVSVTPGTALREDIRVWLERRGDPRSGDFDDSLYMRARVPSSGRLHFFVPARYGELRVAAGGTDWHSGHPQTWDLVRVQGDTLHVKLSMAKSSCDFITGRVASDKSGAVKAVRLACTHYGVVTYTDGRGEFEAHVPFENVLAHRQFIVTRAHMRPEVVPLEMRAAATPGVTGDKPEGPFEITMAAEAEVELRLPYDMDGDETVTGGGERIRLRETRQGPRIRKVKVVWGVQLLFVHGNGLSAEPALYIDEDAWAKAFQQYAEGAETPVIHVKQLSDELK